MLRKKTIASALNGTGRHFAVTLGAPIASLILSVYSALIVKATAMSMRIDAQRFSQQAFSYREPEEKMDRNNTVFEIDLLAH